MFKSTLRITFKPVKVSQCLRTNFVTSQKIRSKESNELVKEEKESKETSLKESLANIPNELGEGPRKEVFQQIQKLSCNDPIYTIEEASLPATTGSISRYFKYPNLAAKHSDYSYFLRSTDNEYSKIVQFPENTDFLMIGAGLVGSATAYYTKKQIDRVGDVVVIDKDPYSPSNCTAICNGLISSQSKSRDTSRISTLSKELIRNLQNDLVCSTEDFAKIKYRPCTHLVLWTEDDVDEVVNSISVQMEDGCYTEAKLPHELEQTFPWLRVKESDVCLGSHGNQDEAIVDPIALRNLYRTLGQAYGVNFIVAEAIDFNTIYTVFQPEISPVGAGSIVARIPATGELRSLSYAKALLCLGHNVPFLESRSDVEAHIRDQLDDMHFLQPKLRICLHFHSYLAPVINFPAITDTDGSLLLNEDYAGNFKYYLNYKDCEELFEQHLERFMNLDSDEIYPNLIHKDELFEKYFENVIKPKLVKRIPLMEDAKFKMAYSGFENYNSHDGCPIISIHPFHNTVLLSGGYGSRLMNYAPAAAASFSELMIVDEEETFDMTPFYWNRVFKGTRVNEFETFSQK